MLCQSLVCQSSFEFRLAAVRTQIGHIDTIEIRARVTHKKNNFKVLDKSGKDRLDSSNMLFFSEETQYLRNRSKIDPTISFRISFLYNLIYNAKIFEIYIFQYRVYPIYYKILKRDQ